MADKGGPTTQSGIDYQNKIAALFLRRMIDPGPWPKDEEIIEVRNENPTAEVDDVVLHYQDHKEWIQVKWNMGRNGKAWVKFWEHMIAQRWRFFGEEDRLVLVMGQSPGWVKDLKEICGRAHGSKKDSGLEPLDQQVEEWLSRLTKGQTNLIYGDIVGKISGAKTEHLQPEALFELFSHLEVWTHFDPNNIKEEHGRSYMPKATLEWYDLFDKLFAVVADNARYGKSISRNELIQELNNQQIEIGVADKLGGIEHPEIIFDESHGQGKWWSLTPTIHKDFKEIANIAGDKISVNYIPSGGNVTELNLRNCRLLVLTIGPQGKTNLTPDEMKDIRSFIRDGGHLLVLSTYTGDWHHEANLNDLLLEEYGLHFNRDVILPKDCNENDAREQAYQYHPSSKCVIEARPALTEMLDDPQLLSIKDPLVKNIKGVLMLSSCSLYIDESNAFPILLSKTDCKLFEPVPLVIGVRIDKYKLREQGPAKVMAASRAGNVIAIGGWKIFADEFINDQRYDNKQLFINILDWAVKN